MRYETVGGVVTRGETFRKMLDHLREIQECMAVMAHLQKTEDGVKDIAMANGWLAMSEAMRRIEAKVITMAQGRLQ